MKMVLSGCMLPVMAYAHLQELSDFVTLKIGDKEYKCMSQGHQIHQYCSGDLEFTFEFAVLQEAPYERQQ